MYLNFFGLKKDPFKITPDPEFFFSGGNRGAVLEALTYAIAKGEGIVKVVGEVGSGKTMLCRMLERELPENCEIIYLANPRLSADEILYAIAHELQLDIPANASKLQTQTALQNFLLDKHANNRRVVMFIEEAQGMNLDTLEEVRMLSNLETTQEKLLQIVLFGQPELEQKLAAHEIRQLKERITYSFNLTQLNAHEIRDYVNTRLRASHYRGNELFGKSAINLLARRSCGLLRRINVLADKALLAAFAQGAHKVTRKHMQMAIKDSNFSAAPVSFFWFLGTGLAALSVVAVIYWWQPASALFGLIGQAIQTDQKAVLAIDKPARPEATDPSEQSLSVKFDDFVEDSQKIPEKPAQLTTFTSKDTKIATLDREQSTTYFEIKDSQRPLMSTQLADSFRMFEELEIDSNIIFETPVGTE